MVRGAIALLARGPSARLGGVLARFDADIAESGLSRAARNVLDVLGASLDVDGSCPPSGPVLVVTNHPGAYDALATMAALGRDDVALVAADRAFLVAMPRLREHLVFVAEGSVLERARSVKRALGWLREGRVLVQFGAGAIEPDARFVSRRELPVSEWREGTGLLAARAIRAGAAIVPCFVSGVHSPRAKRLFFVRWAERRGITTIAPLIQATVPGFRDVAVSVRLGAAVNPKRILDARTDHERTEIVRAAVVELAP